MNQNMQRYVDMAVQLGINVGLKILGALALWVIGRIVIRGILSILNRSMSTRKLDETVSRYLSSVASVLLNILLILAVLSLFGVETTTFAGLLAAAGVAIGVAWSGLLANLAAGVFMIVLRPFKVGDFVTVGGTTGTVHSIGLFVTSVDTMDNVRTVIGNGKIFSDTIQNFSTNPVRRVDCVAQISGGADYEAAMKRLRERLLSIPNVAKDPAPVVEILEFTLAGPVLAVRPFTHTDYYWDVYFATNKLIREELGKAEYPAPAQPVILRQIQPS